MFDLGWSEMVLIGVVALIVVGPKELPGLFRQVGLFMGKARGVAREFTRAMEAAADESGMRDIDRTIRAAANPMKFGTNTLRDAAMGKAPSKVPPAGERLKAGTPSKPATPVKPDAAAKPGGATEALAAGKAEAAARRREQAAARAAARAAEPRPPTPAPETDETA